ncbi:hypothetical protein MRX96_039513 [Rhipicephalus microplus]
MRSATFVLLLVILAPILEVTSFGFGVLLERKSDEPELPDVYGIGMWSPARGEEDQGGKCDAQLVTWAKEGLDVLGEVSAPVKFKDRELQWPLLILKDDGNTLLGLN